MAKDLIIGAYNNYTDFQVLKPWIESINQSGFQGDKVLIAIDSTDEMHQKIVDSGFTVVNIIGNNNNLRIHMLRFLYIYDYLKKHGDNYRFVISTDVRDVIFQKNPSIFLENTFVKTKPNLKFIAQSEAIKICDEKWNKGNIINNFGEYFYNDIKEEEVLNVGILAGVPSSIRDLCFFLYQMSLNRPDWVADQAAYNVMCNYSPFKECVEVLRLKDAWALNAHVSNKPDQMEEFGPFLLEDRPYMKDGIVYNQLGESFVIVHQYDRVPEWTKSVFEKYKIETEKTNKNSSREYFTYKTI